MDDWKENVGSIYSLLFLKYFLAVQVSPFKSLQKQKDGNEGNNNFS